MIITIISFSSEHFQKFCLISRKCYLTLSWWIVKQTCFHQFCTGSRPAILFSSFQTTLCPDRRSSITCQQSSCQSKILFKGENIFARWICHEIGQKRPSSSSPPNTTCLQCLRSSVRGSKTGRVIAGLCSNKILENLRFLSGSWTKE